MQRTQTMSLPAWLAAKPRPRRFSYRHSIALAAQELGIPVSWVWSWAYMGQFPLKKWVGGYYVRLEDVRKALCDPLAVHAAFEATKEPIRTKAAGQLVLSKWPRMPKEIWQPELKRKENRSAEGSADPKFEKLVA